MEDTKEKLYELLKNKQGDSINYELQEEDNKILVLFTTNTISEHCSEVFDVIYETTHALGIKRKDVTNYLSYQVYSENNENIKH